MNFNKLIKATHNLSDSSFGRRKHVCLLLLRNKVVSVGYNSFDKTDAFAFRRGYKFGYPHAELSAIKNYSKAPSTLSRVVLVSIRLSRNGLRMLNARPCPACYRLADSLGIKKIYYTTPNGFYKL